MKKSTILTDEQVKKLASHAHLIFGQDMLDQMDGLGVRFEEVIRLSSLGARCKETREERGLSIKQVAAQLKVAQYRLKAVEEGHQNQMLPDVLRQYICFLGLEKWYRKWAKANPKMVEKLGLTGS